MANNNEFADLENYRKCLLATHFYKCNISGNPTDRFFGYIGPNGTTLARVTQETATAKPSNILVEGSFVHPVGLLAKQALSRDLANGDIKYGQDGVTFYTFYTVNTTAGTSVTFTEPGTVVGVFAKSTAACTGDEVPTFTITPPTAVGGSAVAAIAATQVVPQFSSGASAANNVKELALTTTWANRTFLAGATTTVSTTAGASGTTDAVTYVVAVAHHSA